MNIAVTEVFGQIGEYGKARRGEESSGEAKATNCAISCDMNFSGAGAAVLTSASSLIRCSHTSKNTQTRTDLLRMDFEISLQKSLSFSPKSTDLPF